MNRHKGNTRKGFSLVEMMMVVLILTILVGTMFRQIDRAQTRYSVETRKLDLTQQNRDFIDQFTRDLHQAGYPSPATYGNRVDLSSNLTAAGIWYISQTDLRMEADVDGTGVVEIAYHYDDGTVAGPNKCPCMMRASAAKIVATTSFTSDAVAFAKGKPIELVDSNALLSLVRNVQTSSRVTMSSNEPDHLTPNCPSCNTPMVLREARRGKYAGEKFWGCTNYPKCRGTRQL